MLMISADYPVYHSSLAKQISARNRSIEIPGSERRTSQASIAYFDKLRR